MAVTVFTSDADPENTSVDGDVVRSGVNETLATIIAGAGTSADPTTTNSFTPRIKASTTTNQYQRIQVPFYLFDTSSIDTDEATAATFEYYPATNETALGALNLYLVSSAPASNTDLVASDYGSWGNTALSETINQSAISTGAYKAWTLNAAGLAAIDTTGITKLAMVFENIITGAALPSWSSNAQSVIVAELAGGTNVPKLTVTHSIPITKRAFAGFM